MEYLAEPVYAAVHTEDENFCYTATVLNLDPASLSRLMGPTLAWPPTDTQQTELQLLPHVDSNSNSESQLGSAPTPVSSDKSNILLAKDGTQIKKSERSRTRTVQIPSRFKDYSTLSFTAKKAKLDSS
jgi:hypothetical protein